MTLTDTLSAIVNATREHCELCKVEIDDVYRSVEVDTLDPRSATGDEKFHDLYLICFGRDCFARVQANADRDGGEVVWDGLYRPAA